MSRSLLLKSAITDTLVTQGIQQLLYGAVDGNRRRSGTYLPPTDRRLAAAHTRRLMSIFWSLETRTHVRMASELTIIFETKSMRLRRWSTTSRNGRSLRSTSVADLYSSVGIPAGPQASVEVDDLDAFELRSSVMDGLSSQFSEPIK